MLIPMELQHASEDFERFLADARDISGLTTRNQTYTMVQGVLQTFRRRLSLQDAIRFASVSLQLPQGFALRTCLSEPDRAVSMKVDAARDSALAGEATSPNVR